MDKLTILIVWKEGKVIFEWSMGRKGWTSSYRSEYKAITDTLVWLANFAEEEDNAIIMTDFLVLDCKVESSQVIKIWVQMLKLIESNIKIIYIPGHTRIRYNEKVDSLSASAITFGEIDMTAADVAATFYEQDTAGFRWSRWEYIWPIERLKEKKIEWREIRVFYVATNARW